MADNPNRIDFNARSPVSQLLMSLLIVLGAGTMLFIIFIYGGSYILNIDPVKLDNPDFVPGLKEIVFIRYSVIVQDLSFFIIPSVIILWKVNPGYDVPLFSVKNTGISDIILVIMLAACAFPVTSIAGEWNSRMVLPHWLSGVEQWMKDKEEAADNLISVILNPTSVTGLCLNIAIIAALPAFSEELIFRGIFQRIFFKLLRSGHLAVLIISFIFSALHFQFYGFLPRFILGVIYGYLFLWSRSLWLPVLAHFLNNAVPVAADYFGRNGSVNETATDHIASSIPLALLSITGLIVILNFYRIRSELMDKGSMDSPAEIDEDHH